MEVHRVIEALQPPAHRNLPTQPVVAHVQELELQTRHSLRNRPVYLIMVHVQGRQALIKIHLRQVELELVPRDVDVVRALVPSEHQRCVPLKPVPGKVELPEVDAGEGRRELAGEAVVGEDEVEVVTLEVGKGSRYLPGELVTVEADVAEAGDGGERVGDAAGKLVEGEVEVGEVLELAEEGGDWAGEIEPAEAQEIKVLELGEGLWDRAGEVGELVEGEGLEVSEVADGGGNLAGKVVGEEEEGYDAVGLVVALEAVPVAAVGVRVPGGEEVGVVEGGLYAEEDLLVLGVAASIC